MVLVVFYNQNAQIIKLKWLAIQVVVMGNVLLMAKSVRE